MFAFAIKTQFPPLPPKKAFFVYFFCVSLCLFLAFFELAPFSLSLSLSLPCYFLASFLSVFIFASGSCFFFFLVCLFFVSRCYFVFFFCLLVVLFCFESSCWICFCFASCFLVVVVFLFFLLCYFVIF